MALTFDGRDKMREARRRSPQVAAQKQSAFARRFYAAHPHACRACMWRYLLAWVLFYVFAHQVRWRCELNHRTYRYKAGTEPNKVGVPACEKHHGRQDVLRRWLECARVLWIFPPLGQYAPLITMNRLWHAWKWATNLAVSALVLASAYFASGHLSVSVVLR